jgi:crooked neck
LKFALDRISRSQCAGLYASCAKFEKRHGTRNSIENIVSVKQRIQYEEEIERNRQNYDVWFDYTRLEESICKEDDTAVDEQDAARGRVREVYERSVAQVPPGIGEGIFFCG